MMRKSKKSLFLILLFENQCICDSLMPIVPPIKVSSITNLNSRSRINLLEYQNKEYSKSHTKLKATPSSSSFQSKQSRSEHIKELKKQAKLARLEAEKMDIELSLIKLKKLEQRLSSGTFTKEMYDDMRQEIDVLSERFNVTKVPKEKDQIISIKNYLKDQIIQTSNEMNIIVEDKKDEGKVDKTVVLSSSRLKNEIEASSNNEKADLQTASVATILKEETVPSTSNLTIEREAENKTSLEQQQKALEGYLSLPLEIQEMIAQSLNLAEAERNNATLIIELLDKENRLVFDSAEEDPTIVLKDEDILNYLEIDTEFEERAGYVNTILPSCTRDLNQCPYDTDVLFFMDLLFASKVFAPKERKPVIIPGGVVIRGQNKCKSASELVEKLDLLLEQNETLRDSLGVFYLKDPTPLSDEEIELGMDMELPCLVVLGKNVTLKQNPLLSFLTSNIAFFSLILFGLSSNINFNNIEQSLPQISQLSFLQLKSSLEVIIGLIGIQVMHEIGHVIIAKRDNIKLQAPILLPSLNFGIMGCMTNFQSFPQSLTSLYDFAIAGPFVGYLSSLWTMYIGLQQTIASQTMNMNWPSVPMEFFKSSVMGNAIMEYVLGQGYLLYSNTIILQSTNDLQQKLLLHPFVLVGYCGLLLNSLALLPIGNTDGGRISQAIFGRTFSRLVQAATFLTILALQLLSWDEQNILLTYGLFVYLFQRETEIPCRNEVDEVDLVRGLFSFLLGVFVILCLAPVL